MTPDGNPDRVALTDNYTPLTGLAYSVEGQRSGCGDHAGQYRARTAVAARVRGFGPKNAEKHLELIVKRTNFDYAPPAMLLMRSADDCSAMHFTIGDSNPKDYSGHDRSGSSILPSFGAVCDSDTTMEVNSDDKNTVANPKAQTFTNPSLPPWLRSADDARAVPDRTTNERNQPGTLFHVLGRILRQRGQPGIHLC
jgi:hypothetical protein